MKRSTVAEEMIVSGRPYIGFPWPNVTLSVKTREEGGLVWKISGLEIPLVPQVMGGTSQVGSYAIRRISHNTFRYEGIELRAPEHLISALCLRGITDATLEINPPASRIIPTLPIMNVIYSPPVGDGAVSTFYDKLKPSDLQGETVDWRVDRRREVSADYGKVIVEPSDRLEVVVAGWKSDPYGINAEEFRCEDVYNTKDSKLLKARGLLGLFSNGYVYWAASPLRLLLSGVSAKNYVPSYAPERMSEYFREKRNEHFAHLTFSDFPAELFSVFEGRVYGKFTFFKTGGSHKGRMGALKHLRDNGIIIPN